MPFFNNLFQQFPHLLQGGQPQLNLSGINQPLPGLTPQMSGLLGIGAGTPPTVPGSGTPDLSSPLRGPLASLQGDRENNIPQPVGEGELRIPNPLIPPNSLINPPPTLNPGALNLPQNLIEPGSSFAPQQVDRDRELTRMLDRLVTAAKGAEAQQNPRGTRAPTPVTPPLLPVSNQSVPVSRLPQRQQPSLRRGLRGFL